MKRIMCGLALTLVVLLTLNCERDDVCAGSTPTTPRVVIEFFNYTNNSQPRNVTNFTIKSADNDSIIRFTNVNKIFVPLKTFETSTTYTFTINDDDVPQTPTFADTVTFTYATRDIYVSRACGYKTVFDLSQETGIPGLVVNNGAGGNWLETVIIDNHTIEFEDETHIRIYF
ncbi:DUF6452 family protein [Flavobacterium selenitireducens]|uniref:DUF6452 family protein n=1 Tax=Flavobacterium selenitireducens TaxID=2722704 RepID=UPI00168BF1A2|nr:DUF6452 family protein [Flavobacterium selenitireducens]MBD3581460.1 hypothetical protein [Flavobacterium selenitireducens]